MNDAAPERNSETPAPTVNAAAQAWRSALRLFCFVVVATALMSMTHSVTRTRIQAALTAEKMKFISEVLPAERYDNDLLADSITLPPTPELGLKTESRVYRARKDGKYNALVLEAVAPDGYAGAIRLLIGISRAGEITGVRVVDHRETPGLGDYIDPRRDKNKTRPWIAQFTGLIAPEIPDADWRVKKERGRFDAYAGATVSPRAVIEAVRKAARFAARSGERLFEEKTP
ncbi:MAG: electron transport complex subunit RsxG [Zoogloeaceae bacterium]|nr:electron transport complex subunit RsxG [Zoogloeaceae bacterium]